MRLSLGRYHQGGCEFAVIRAVVAAAFIIGLIISTASSGLAQSARALIGIDAKELESKIPFLAAITAFQEIPSLDRIIKVVPWTIGAPFDLGKGQFPDSGIPCVGRGRSNALTFGELQLAAKLSAVPKNEINRTIKVRANISDVSRSNTIISVGGPIGRIQAAWWTVLLLYEQTADDSELQSAISAVDTLCFTEARNMGRRVRRIVIGVPILFLQVERSSSVFVVDDKVWEIIDNVGSDLILIRPKSLFLIAVGLNQ